MAKQEKLPVSRRALLQRISRKAEALGQTVRKVRGEELWAVARDGYVRGTHSLDGLAATYRVLADFERIAD